ncbi:MAG: nucleotidyltransferase family protein [Cyanobacteria bacterium J06639_14]
MKTSLELLRAQKKDILAIATKHGASNIRVFGSVARGEATEESDIDLLIDLEPNRSLLDHIGLMQDLEDLLGCPVDIVEAAALHERIRDRALKDATEL